MLPEPIKNLIKHFNDLPGIGTKTSQKFIFYLLQKSPRELENFAQAILDLKSKLTVCEKCYNFSENQFCEICNDKNRNQKIICVIENPRNIEVIEATKKFNGVYHILGGLIDNLNGITPDKLNISQLINRIKKENPEEIILAFNSNISGEETTLYLKKILSDFDVKITRLGRGLPMDADLEYADEITLANALEYRNKISPE